MPSESEHPAHDEIANPEWFREPTRREHGIAGARELAQKMRHQLFGVVQIFVLKFGGELLRLLVLQTQERSHAVIWLGYSLVKLKSREGEAA